ncbi:retinol dehydrogenase 14-like [Tropilaelaps mercedesae]|uniref:Retinol dehydrogenase 14-like n=1 Tax=Tropilaelaps mercedesae TaxID=418985 RepID=A0A1V9X097_9ACAR|nr:retinol dehydrogenase 14-like [Tropilaelaps mercedesae]
MIQMVLYSLLLRLYGFFVLHLFGLWIFALQLAHVYYGTQNKRFNFVRQERKIFVVTGGLGGIGRKVTERLMSLGAFVIITGRRPNKDPSLKKSMEELSALSSSFKYFQVELESMSNTVRFCDTVKASFDRLDGLICNAGTLGPSYRTTPEGFESQQAVNYLSPIVLMDQFQSLLKSTEGRVVLVSSAAHRIGYCNLDDFMFSKAYCPYLGYVQSKLALVAYTRHVGPTLLRECGITVNAVHPGVVNTGLYSNPIVKLIGKIAFISATTSAETILFPLLSATLERVTGQYMENCEISLPATRVMDREFTENLYKYTRNLLGPWLQPHQAAN